MAAAVETILRQQLLDRRRRLNQAASIAAARLHVRSLICEVDSALARLEAGTYGLCEVCHEPVEADRLICDPLTRFCLDHLTSDQQRALEQDLVLAARIQKGLLPEPHLTAGGWQVAYRYEPAGIVSGDYCDLVTEPGGGFYFMLGDVTGKGVAASMLMAHLQATFRTLIPLGLALPELVERASRLFCESTLPTHYATLVCGRASVSGEVEVCNAGHPPPLLLRGGEVLPIEPTGLLLGAFCDERFTASRVRVEPGEALLLYTDGLSEARDGAGRMYGAERIQELARGRRPARPDDLIGLCLEDLHLFRKDVRAGDDLTIMAVCRSPES
jgi:sigma-B regulation protein RsbU (phosphoserine phosphatase)